MAYKILGVVVIFLAVFSGGGYYYLTSYQESCWGNLAHPQKAIVLFDFDGTLCDSLDSALSAFNAVASKYNLTPAPGHQGREEYRHMLTQEFFKKHRVSKLKLPFVIHDMKKVMKQYTTTLRLFPKIKDALVSLKKRGLVLGILTSSPLETVEVFLKQNGLEVFDFIYHGSTVFGKDRLLKKIRSQSKASSLYYVADEVRDIEACRKAGVPIISVTWGFHAADLLRSHKPDYLLESPTEITSLKALETLAESSKLFTRRTGEDGV